MADSSSTVTDIPIWIAGGCWARCQLHASIRTISTRSILIELVAALREVSGREEPKEWLRGGGTWKAVYK